MSEFIVLAVSNGWVSSWPQQYAMFLILVFLAELVAGISGFVFRHEIKDILRVSYKSAMDKYDGTGPQSKTLDTIQRNLECCGSENYTDWGNTDYF
uniref:Tetraspanin n=1 Tax=Anguilla anguilla TaxID=7936 RepID=A0A0E9QF39_ANGAN